MPIQNVVYQIDFDDSKAQAAFAKLRQNIAKANDDYEKFVKSSKKPTGDSVDKLADNLETADDKTRRAAKGLDLLAASLAGVQSETEDIDSKQIEELGNAADKTAEKIKKVGKAKKDAGLGKDDAGGSPKTEKLSKEEKELEKEANKKLEKEKKERTLDGKLSSFSQAANAGSDFKEALQAGDLKGAVESVKDFGGSLSALASPTGLAVAGAAAVVGALALTANAAAEGAKKIAEYKKQIGELSGIKGQDAENLAVNIAALSEVYGTDSEQYIKAVNTISQNRKITVQQADELLTQQVERGFSNEELKQLTEYDIQLKDFNFTTQQSINLIRNGKKFGFFDDKLPDAIKEAKIKILEFSTSAQDALKPLGDKFYNQLKLDLANKTKTGPELIQAIAKETQTQLKAGKIDKGQVQYIVTDVLGGSQGEDLGNSNTINFFADLDKQINEALPPLNAAQQSSANLKDAYVELNKEFAIFGNKTGSASTAIELLGVQFQTFFTKIVNSIAPALISVANFFSNIFKNSEKLAIVFRSLYDITSDLFSSLGQLAYSILPSLNNEVDSAAKAAIYLGYAYEALTFPVRAVISTLSLAIKTMNYFSNSARKLSNDFLGTSFEIDPSINTKSFQKDVADYKKLASNFYINDSKKEKTKDTGTKPPPPENTGTTGARPQISGSPDKEKPFEVKIEANTKPFDDAIAKVKEDILKIEQDALIATIQFNFEIEKETLPVAQEFAAQFENDFQKRKSTIQLQNEIETINKTTQLVRDNEQQALLDKFSTEKEKISTEVESVIERQRLVKILNTQFETENAKISDKFEKNKSANAILIAKKESDFIEQTERAAILVRLKTIKVLKEQVEKELFTNTVNTLNFTTKLSENTTNFSAQERNVKDLTALKAEQAKKEQIDSQNVFNNTLLGIDKDIALKRQEFANATSQEQKEKALQAIQDFEKEKALLIEKQAISEKNVAIAAIELEFEKQDKLFAIRKAALENQQKIVNQEKAIIEEGLKNASGAVDKINEIASKLYSNDKTSFSAGALSAISGITSGVNQTVDLFKARRLALDNQANKQIDLDKALKQQDILKGEKGKQQSIINSPDTFSTEDIDKAKEDLATLETQSAEVDENVNELTTGLEDLKDLDFKKLIKELLNLAEVINNSVFQVLQDISQATINELDKNIAKQKEQISTIESALKEGGDAAKNYSVEQLEAERERLKATEELRKAEIQKQNDYMIAQLVINGAIAVSQTFATVPFPFNIVAAALVIGSLVAQIAVVRSQMRAQKAEKGIIGIGEKDRPKGMKLEGARHSDKGILIEAEGGESILTRNATRKYWAIAKGMNEGNLTAETVLKHFPAIGFEKEQLALETKKILSLPTSPQKMVIPIMPVLQGYRQEMKELKQAMQATSITQLAKQVREIQQQNIQLTINNNSDLSELKSELSDIKKEIRQTNLNLINLGKTEVHLDENGIYSIHQKIAHRKERIRNHK